jgi:hypothetical protein
VNTVMNLPIPYKCGLLGWVSITFPRKTVAGTVYAVSVTRREANTLEFNYEAPRCIFFLPPVTSSLLYSNILGSNRLGKVVPLPN